MQTDEEEDELTDDTEERIPAAAADPVDDPIPGTRNKPTKAEKEVRVNLVMDVLLMGLRPDEISRYLTEKKNLKISRRTVDRYIQEATERIIQAAEVDRPFELGQAKKRLDHLYQRNISIQDFKAALAVIRERSALLGLNEPTKTDITTAGKEIATLVVRYEDKNGIPGNPATPAPEAG
jgi:hypothetical protein